MKQDLGLDARRVLCCVVCVFGLWHGTEPEAGAVGLDSHRRSLMGDKAEVCGEQGRSLFLSFAPQRPLSPHSRLLLCKATRKHKDNILPALQADTGKGC